MSEKVTLSGLVTDKANTWNEKVGNKNIDDLGGTNEALAIVINEITLNIWPTMYSIALAIEEVTSMYNDHANNSAISFKTITANMSNLMTSIKKRDVTLTESINKSLQALNKQMIDQNKALDRRIIELSKSINKSQENNNENQVYQV